MTTTKTKKELKLNARKTSLSQKTNQQLIDIVLKKDNTERKNNEKIVLLHRQIDELNVLIDAKNPTMQDNVFKQEIKTDSKTYTRIKEACLRGDYVVHFLERDFQPFEERGRCSLLKFSAWDWDGVRAQFCNLVGDLASFSEVIVLVSDSGMLHDSEFSALQKQLSNIPTHIGMVYREVIDVTLLCC